MQPEHFEAIRMLPSFRKRVEDLLAENNATRARNLVENDEALFNEIEMCFAAKNKCIINLLRAMHVLSNSGFDVGGVTSLYMTACTGTLHDSDILQNMFNSVKRMTPSDVINLARRISEAIENGSSELDLDSWSDEFYEAIVDIQTQVMALVKEAAETEAPIRSTYTSLSKAVRTTVVAQKVQLRHELSKFSKLDTEFTTLIDRLSQVLEQFITFETPQDLFLHEAWVYDSKSPYRDVFAPKPRFAIERALSVPHDYLGCRCCKASIEGLSSSQPVTAILYQLYLETGSLINIFDLWSAFLAIVGGEDDGFDERAALVLFYRGLADLKLLGMIKQSRKKTDHVAKLAWKGL